MPTKSFNLFVKNIILPFKKKIKVDSDKSISIRSFLLGSISQNITSIKNVLESEDVLTTINCLKQLGVKIIKKKTGEYLVYGKGLGSMVAKKNTALNFCASWLPSLMHWILLERTDLGGRMEPGHASLKRSSKATKCLNRRLTTITEPGCPCCGRVVTL